MKTNNKLKNRRTAVRRKIYQTTFITSRDGTVLGYREMGHGPGLVLLHGSMSSGYNHIELAEALAAVFTVYIPDRRGRGLSGPYHGDYGIQTEVEDLLAILAETGAHHIFGVSSGGIIALQAALILSTIHKAAVYEPPLFADNSTATALLTRFDREMARGRVAAALTTGMKGAQMGPPIFSLMPRQLLELLVSLAMKNDARKDANGYIPMKELAPTLHYDFQLVAQVSGQLQSFRDIRGNVLLLGGSKSPAYLKTALCALEKSLLYAERVELPGPGHEASWNSDRGGQPELVAQELKRFFA